jgi:N-sulfoglucosamine sulfohydrolase
VSRPNIIYMHSHDTGRYLQPYGYAVPTPQIQAMAEQGVVFRQAFAAAPTCSPSRAALLTGQSPHEAGMLGLAHRGFALKDPDQHLAAVLKRSGYDTHICGFQHEAETTAEIGYRNQIPTDSVDAAHVAPAAAAFIRSKPKQPFFLTVGFHETHRIHNTRRIRETGQLDCPFVRSESGEPIGDPRYVRPPGFLPDTPDTRRDWADYLESARRLDTGVGEVIDALDEAGLADNTLVISTTDHGVPFYGGKSTLSDHGLGVSLILRGPGGFTGGKVVDAMVSHVDVFPTLCELTGIEKPAWLTGQSLLPLVNGTAQILNEEVFGEVTFHAAYEPLRSVRTQRWKYIRRFDARHRPVLVNTEECLTKTVLVRAGLADRLIDTEQLYDLVFDPNEACNVANDPANAAVLAEMRQRLASWMQRTADPLLQGEVPPTPRAVSMLCDPNAVSAYDMYRRSNVSAGGEC